MTFQDWVLLLFAGVQALSAGAQLFLFFFGYNRWRNRLVAEFMAKPGGPFGHGIRLPTNQVPYALRASGEGWLYLTPAYASERGTQRFVGVDARLMQGLS